MRQSSLPSGCSSCGSPLVRRWSLSEDEELDEDEENEGEEELAKDEARGEGAGGRRRITVVLSICGRSLVVDTLWLVA